MSFFFTFLSYSCNDITYIVYNFKFKKQVFLLASRFFIEIIVYLVQDFKINCAQCVAFYVFVHLMIVAMSNTKLKWPVCRNEEVPCVIVYNTVLEKKVFETIYDKTFK